MKYVLVCNAGSSSLKFALFTWPQGRVVGRGEFDRIGSRHGYLNYTLQAMTGEGTYSGLRDHRRAARILGQVLRFHGFRTHAVQAIMHRFVFGGSLHRSMRITRSVERTLRRGTMVAPLHNSPALMVLDEMRKNFRRIPEIACFDTSFFYDLPQVSHTYALDYRIAKKYHIRRFGFHGLSHSQVSRQAARMIGRSVRSLNLITIHLGAGCSIAAIARGKPIDTSMGFSPLEGLVMASRPGDLDPGVIIYLLEQGMSVFSLVQLLNHSSGWIGMTGYSADMRDIIRAAGLRVRGYVSPTTPTRIQRERSKLALGVFMHRLRKYLAAYVYELGRVDAVVFTGGIGAHNADIRRLALKKLKLPGSPKILSLVSDEETEMFREARLILR